jgi:hypothetical protein
MCLERNLGGPDVPERTDGASFRFRRAGGARRFLLLASSGKMCAASGIEGSGVAGEGRLNFCGGDWSGASLRE